jgi:hypothetical protein
VRLHQNDAASFLTDCHVFEIAIDQGLLISKNQIFTFINHLFVFPLNLSSFPELIARLTVNLYRCRLRGLACRPLDIILVLGLPFRLLISLILQTVTFFGYSALLWKAVLKFC